ncbi:MAG: hypothetical protein IT437_02430 [Phycisphaerales bacterium]|nr:hypothetical protein [Phycisphaerales bacterium]
MRSSVASVLGLVLIALTPGSPASAQPTRRTPGGVVVTIPYVVRMHVADQRFKVVTKEIGPFANSAWRDALPSRVPVVTVFPDGRAERGFYIYNRFGKAVVSIPYDRPGSVHYDAKSGYRASTSIAYSGPRLEKERDSWIYRGATWAAGVAIRLASEDYFHVYYSGKLAAGAPGGSASCYPDCNDDGVLNLADFGCFQTKFALQDSYADCNGDGLLNLSDFGCFLTKFALGCPYPAPPRLRTVLCG